MRNVVSNFFKIFYCANLEKNILEHWARSYRRLLFIGQSSYGIIISRVWLMWVLENKTSDLKHCNSFLVPCNTARQNHTR